MHSLRLAAAALFSSLALSACVPDPAMIEAGLAEPPPARLAADSVYGPVVDAGLNVPGVPVDQVPDEFQRQTVYFETDQPAGTIIINPGAKQLFLVTGRNQAMRYGIAVGRSGFQWSGEALITERKNWPTWTPPEEMIERKPELREWEDGMPGGLENPLGARALYLTTDGVDYGYRIHGTPEWFSIGKNASSGCIRMINQDVIDLYGWVADGAKVIVLRADGTMPSGLTLPPPQPKPEVKIEIPALIILPPPSFGAPAAPAITPLITPIVDPAAASTAPVDPAFCLVMNADGTCLCPVLLVNGLCPAPVEN